jgi:hypothetical protein
MSDFATSNLSKIKPKLRTSGAISQPRRKAGSPLKMIGETKGNVGNLPTQTEYLERLKTAYSMTNDQKLKTFIQDQIRIILVQRGEI